MADTDRNIWEIFDDGTAPPTLSPNQERPNEVQQSDAVHAKENNPTESGEKPEAGPEQDTGKLKPAKKRRVRRKKRAVWSEDEEAKPILKRLKKKHNGKSVSSHAESLPVGPVVHVEGKHSAPKSVAIVNRGGADAGEEDRPAREARLVEVDKTVQYECTFCHNTASSLGPLFGPYEATVMDKRQQIWLHSHCFIWTPECYLAEGRLTGLDESLTRAATSACKSCGELTATLCCVGKNCKKLYHYVCAVNAGCDFNEQNFSILCSTHKPKPPPPTTPT